MADLPDVTDPDIRAMVLAVVVVAPPFLRLVVAEPPKFRRVLCELCRQDWPCPSHNAAWEAEKQAAREAIARVERQAEYADRPYRKSRWWFGG